MSVSLEGRNIYELGEVHPRSYGLKATEVSTTVKLNLSYNHLRTLQRPFARSGVGGIHVSAATTGAAVSSSPSAATATATGALPVSLEEESSALRPFISLEHLLVNHNQLRSLVGLCGAANTLTVLVATHNALTSLDGMQACTHLTYADLSHNSIESLRGLPLIFQAPFREGDSPRSAPAHDACGRAALESMADFSHRRVCAVAGAAPRAQVIAAEGVAVDDDAEIILKHVAHDDNEGRPPIPAVSMSLQTSLGADTHQHTLTPSGAGHSHPRTHNLHQQQQQLTSGRSPEGTWNLATRPSRCTKGPIQRGVSETAISLRAGASEAASLLLPGAKSDCSCLASSSSNTGVVLLLSHNRLRGRALMEMMWVESGDGGMGAAQGSTPSSARPLLRPWCTALTHLDVSHNCIEDTREVRRLFTPIRWPSSTATATCTPALARLRRLDISGNPFLVNGSLAEELTRSAQSPPPAAAAPSTASSSTSRTFTPTNTRQPAIKRTNGRQGHAESAPQTSVEATMVNDDRYAMTRVHFRLNYTSRMLDAALRTPTPSARAVAFPSLAAAQGAMEALLASLANRWQCTEPSSSPPVTAAMPSCFSLEGPGAAVEEALQPCIVDLRGGELTVLAAALQQRGAHLGEILEVPSPASATVPCAKRAATSPTPTRGGSGGSPPSSEPARNIGAACADSSLVIFLTPPPRWSRGASAGADTSVLSSGSGPSPPAAQRPTAQMSSLFVSPTPPRVAAVEAAQDTGSLSDDAVSTAITNGIRAETSTMGYRLYQGRGHQQQLVSVANTRDGDSAAVVAHFDAAAAVSHSAAAPPPADSVELQLLRAEVVELRRRYRQLQCHTRSQTCVLQRQEATIRELKEIAALAQREQLEAQAGLSNAQLEIRRLREQVQALNGSAAQVAPPQPTSVPSAPTVSLKPPPPSSS
ncbi:hypothetical protein LSCM4_08121 [Leishmania orientalis]|uniref:Leucine-rich repeat protein n=1 Tax=Leishmania orientalis TaxID=2249476 RepID=A0A836L3W3_9TRYP|nr:hypothetical protein LSCM4_08121 [Leishmania orientalis]